MKTLEKLHKERELYRNQIISYNEAKDFSDEPEIVENLEESICSCFQLLDKTEEEIKRLEDGFRFSH